MELVGAIGLEPTTPTMSIGQCGDAVVRRQLLTLLGSVPERPQMPEHDWSGPTAGPPRTSGSRRKVIRESLPSAGAVAREVVTIDGDHVQYAQALPYGDE